MMIKLNYPICIFGNMGVVTTKPRPIYDVPSQKSKADKDSIIYNGTRSEYEINFREIMQ